MIWLLLIPYCAAAYAIHGGELATGINRQVRNVLCAIPFAAVAYMAAHGMVSTNIYIDSGCAFTAFWLAFAGTNMGFDNHPLWLKGLITFPPLGAALLPLAYANKSWTASTCEYLSGALYGTALFLCTCFV